MSFILDLLRRAPVIPVLVIERLENALPLARALVAGGLPVLEITLRTPVALEAIRAIAGEVEGAVVGAGTVLGRGDLDAVERAGGRFAVSPGLTEALAEPHAVPLLPGVATASELMRGIDLGLKAFKFFPAVPAGGVAMLTAFQGPLGRARFCPTGGIDASNASDFLALRNVLCVGGSWVAPANAVREGDWSAITRLADEASRLGRFVDNSEQ